MTVKELKEKLNEFDDNLIVMIPSSGWKSDGYWCPTPATCVTRGINEADCTIIIDDYDEDD